MAALKLIKEQVEDVEYLMEGNDADKSMYIKGVFLQSGIKNRNGRLYPEHVMDREVNRYIAQNVETRKAYGELGHPDKPAINPDRISHRIVSLHKEGLNYIGKAKLSNTPMGNIAKNLIAEGGQLAVSSRGLGSIKKLKEHDEVQEDFTLATAADIVIDPSAPDAFVNGILESKEWIWVNGILQEQTIAGYATELKNVSRPNMEETALKLFEDFIKKVSKSKLV